MVGALPPVSTAEVAASVAKSAKAGEVLLVGLTGSVAAGKSTLGAGLKAELDQDFRVEVIPTDGFLMDNARLTELGILGRKGFPETYDADALMTTLAVARQGPASFPGYSHILYDIDPALARTVDRPDILILEGLGLSGFPDGRSAREALDLMIYLDAEEADLETWYVRRFLEFWRAAETDPASFYARFRQMDEAQVDAFARQVWAGVNLPNLRDHIRPGREVADIVLEKALDHTLRLARPAAL